MYDYDPLENRPDRSRPMNYQMGGFSNDNARSRGEFYGYPKTTAAYLPRANEVPNADQWHSMNKMLQSPQTMENPFNRRNDGDDPPLVGQRRRDW